MLRQNLKRIRFQRQITRQLAKQKAKDEEKIRKTGSNYPVEISSIRKDRKFPFLL